MHIVSVCLAEYEGCNVRLALHLLSIQLQMCLKIVSALTFSFISVLIHWHTQPYFMQRKVNLPFTGLNQV